MTIDINDVAENLSELLTNSTNMAGKFYDIFFNTTPMDVELQQYDDNNVLQTYTIPNRAKDRLLFIEGTAAPENNITADVGTIFVDTLTEEIYFKISGSGSNGWKNVFSNDLLNDSQLSIDGTLSDNSDTLIPSQKAVKTYSDTKYDSSNFIGGVNYLAPNGDGSDLYGVNKGHPTYCANYGKIDATYNEANCAYYSGSTVYIDTSTNYVLLTFPNYKTYCVSSVTPLVVAASGTIIIREADLLGTLNTTVINGRTYPTYTATLTNATGTIYEQKAAPTNTSGVRWLNTSVVPSAPQVGDGSVWVLEQFVKIATVTYSGSAISALVNFPYNKSNITKGYSRAYDGGNAVSTTITVAGTYYGVTSSSITSDNINGGISWSNGVGTCISAGTYLVDYDASIYCATATQKVRSGIFKNSSIINGGISEGYVLTSNYPTEFSGKAIIKLAVGDTIQLAVTNVTAGNPLLIAYSNIVVIEIL